MLLVQFERQVIAGKKLNRTWKKNFSGDIFLYLYLQNEGVSRHETLRLF